MVAVNPHYAKSGWPLKTNFYTIHEEFSAARAAAFVIIGVMTLVTDC